MKGYIKMNQSGDTIIEVLISIVVVSIVLAGAYASANNSLTSTQSSQERGEAIKVVESQLERLKVKALEGSTAEIFTATTPDPYQFCLDSSLSVETDLANCTFNGRYEIVITRDVTDNRTFNARAEWDALGGGRDNAVIVYRVFTL